MPARAWIFCFNALPRITRHRLTLLNSPFTLAPHRSGVVAKEEDDDDGSSDSGSGSSDSNSSSNGNGTNRNRAPSEGYKEGSFSSNQAIVKIDTFLTKNMETRLSVAEGNGPVDALAKALRSALRDDFPQLDGISLSDYKVDLLSQGGTTAAVTRVTIDFVDSATDLRWRTVGAHSSIIEASFALWWTAWNTASNDARTDASWTLKRISLLIRILLTLMMMMMTRFYLKNGLLLLLSIIKNIVHASFKMFPVKFTLTSVV